MAKKKSSPSSSCRSRPARPRPRRPSARPSGSTASTSWTSAGSTTRRRSSSPAGHPGGTHDLRGPFVLVHHQAAAGRGADQARRGHREGLGRSQPQQGRRGSRRTGSQDRGAEDGRPERERRRAWRCGSSRARRAAWAWRWSMTAHGQAIPRRGRAIDRRQEYPPGEAIKVLKSLPEAKFDETVEVAFRLGDRPAQGRPDDPRHRVAAQRHRQDPSASPCSPWATRRVRPKRPAPTSWAARSSSRRHEGQDRLRRSGGHAGHDGRGRQGRTCAGSARAHAEPEDGHGDHGHRQGGRGHQGRQGRVPGRTQGNVHVIIGKKSFDEHALLENYLAVVDEILRAKPQRRRAGTSRPAVSSTMGPSVRIDPPIRRASI